MKFFTTRKMTDLNSILQEAAKNLVEEYEKDLIRQFKEKLAKDRVDFLSYVDSKIIEFIKESGGDEITIRFKGDK